MHLGLLVLAILAGRGAGYVLFEGGTPTGITPGAAGGGGGGGGGGEQVTYIDISVAVPAPSLPPEEVLVEPEPEVVPPPLPEAERAPSQQTPVPPAPTTAPGSGAGSAGGTGTGTGGGAGEGAGSGVGPGSGGGTGGGTGGGVGSGTGEGTGAGRMQPPVPEVLLLPPPRPPARLRGQALVVRVSIDTTGRVREAEFRSTGDRGYDSRLRRVAMDWRFRPARDPAGNPVAVDYDVSLLF